RGDRGGGGVSARGGRVSGPADDELARRLRAAAGRVPGPEVERIVAEARRAAAREAAGLLQQVMTRAILERAVEQLAPEPAPEGPPAAAGGAPLWYAYGVQRAADPRPPALAGVGGAAVEGVEAAGLRALVSAVPAADYGEDSLRRRLEDLDWLDANARAHEDVLVAAMGGGPVLPLRFATVFRGRGQLVAVLDRHAAALHAEADRIAGHGEWGAKAVVDLAACDRWLDRPRTGDGGDGDRGPGAGRSYLARRRSERGDRERRRLLLLEVATEIHEALDAEAVESRLDRPQDRQLSGHDGAMILNGAYLLVEDGEARFRARAAALGDRHAAAGVTVEVTGPWPPHHFVSLPPVDDGEPAR